MRYEKKVDFPASDFPLKNATVQLDVTFSVDVPRAAQARWIKEALEEFAQRVDLRGLEPPSKGKETQEDWGAPEGMDLRRVKSAHRFIVAAAALAERGPSPTLAEIATKARLSMPPIYRLIDPEDESGAYVAPLISVEKRGRSKAVDLTPLGRKVASRIRAGTLPA